RARRVGDHHDRGAHAPPAREARRGVGALYAGHVGRRACGARCDRSRIRGAREPGAPRRAAEARGGRHEAKGRCEVTRTIEITLNALGILALLGALSLLAGCGASALATQARAAQVAAIATAGAGEVIDAARDRALDAVEEAHPVRGPERDAALDAEAARWRPAGQALDAIREVLVTWTAAIEAARVVGEQGMAAIWPRI